MSISLELVLGTVVEPSEKRCNPFTFSPKSQWWSNIRDMGSDN
ncbi:predicted protein [Sclerotinia sclerotiorum 1980 UF-70]|uniref:Uncharacterized protein n=1 Tax=Sclerotinia sclerotiorum (strain ATCC 18683 / 1980 / Ss-1) TaxID=665079 RepID=A7F8B5_SCLS1|nr:predicted protein [Sclerotinia sclerotiorum 1980 UF-70]EDN98986.1 predicted protein [Sclerotinia sclerotiorum 1980 UF-70]